MVIRSLYLGTIWITPADVKSDSHSGKAKKSFKGSIVSPGSAVLGEPVHGTGSGLEPPVGGKFQPQLRIGYPGGGAHLIFELNTHGSAGHKVHENSIDALTAVTQRNLLDAYFNIEFLRPVLSC
jgi:hypothetical protein